MSHFAVMLSNVDNSWEEISKHLSLDTAITHYQQHCEKHPENFYFILDKDTQVTYRIINKILVMINTDGTINYIK